MRESRSNGRKGQSLMWGEPPVDADSVEERTFQLPVGTVTFMLTDIEASTRLWESASEAMRAAVARHYELLDAAIALHGGVRPMEQGEGDSVVAAFPRASDALAASLDIQRAFHHESWPQRTSLKLRIALHTAEAQLRDEGNYFGQAVNRCARLRDVAHGGQVVLSRTTRDLVLDRLPDGAELADRGLHRLRDLGRPEHIFELRHPDLPGEFPALRSLDVLPNNLPGELTSFVGRRDELAKIEELLGGARLLTLAGSGGCGKTRLALQAAADSMDHHPDGVWWVELAPIEDPNLLPAALTGAIGLHEVAGQASIKTLVKHLRERRALVVLDNCEHLLAACAELAAALLRACPSLTILTTSRSPLGVPGEKAWRVPSMSLPTETSREPIDALAQSDAVRLFIDRGVQVRPNFVVTAANAPAVAQICYDLDGIPLAIELAAARVRMMAPEQIARALGDRFHLLTGGSRTVMPRQQTLQASIDWSFELLTEGEKVLLRRLSVFAGGWTLDAAEEVCSGDGIDRYALLDLLTGLVDKSLVTTDEQGSEMRYGLLESIRQYAAAGLAEAGEVQAVRGRHLDYYVRLAEGSEPELLRAGREDPVLRTLTDEVPNLRSALEWAATAEPSAALRIAASLHLFWLFTGRYHEGESAYAIALDAAGEEPTPLRGRALCARAHLGLFGGLFAEVPLWAQEALRVGEACGDLSVQARASDILGTVFGAVHPPAGPPLLERSVELAGQVGDEWCKIDALQFLAWCRIFQDDFDAAHPLLDEARAAANRLGYRWGNAMHWLELSRIAKLEGRLTDFDDLLIAMLNASDEVGDPVTRSMAAHAQAWIAVERGQAEKAKRLGEGPLAQVTETEAGIAVGFANQVMARVELALGNLGEARRHLELAIEADRLRLAYFLPEHLSLLGTLDLMEGKIDAAFDHGKEALEIGRRVGSRWLQSFAERLLARVALAAGEPSEAELYVHDALSHLVANGLALYIPECLDNLAAVAAAQESFEEAARLLGAAAAGRDRLGTVRVPAEQDFWGGIELTTRAALGDDVYQAAFAAGGAMETDEAVAYARRARGDRKRPSSGWDSLTPTELEVVRHVAAGLTNAEIGSRMFISRGTAKIHLFHIFAKLGISSRSQLAAEATRRGLEPPAETYAARR
jgi:predicted ATPase/class 3 adenylate cyclase/DNA-binding CsgD family transcriptional regulator